MCLGDCRRYAEAMNLSLPTAKGMDSDRPSDTRGIRLVRELQAARSLPASCAHCCRKRFVEGFDCRDVPASAARKVA